MRIKFYILWFENEPTWIEGKINDVKDIVKEEGFEWVEPMICKKGSEFRGDYNDFDIILVDYRLVGGRKEGQSGADIINTIRKNCYSTIIFYSQDGEQVLRKEIADKRLDGVFCVSRDDFLDRFEQIFHTTTKKVEDINNLRGLVMAETADLESLKMEIIELYDKLDCPKKKDMIKKTIDTMSKNVDDQRVFFDSTTENTTFVELLDRFNFYRKSITVHRINKIKNSRASFNHEQFRKEIIDKRNLLAHVKEEKNEDGEIYLESRDKQLVFSREEAKKIRNDILKYRRELGKIKEVLQETIDER